MAFRSSFNVLNRALSVFKSVRQPKYMQCASLSSESLYNQPFRFKKIGLALCGFGIGGGVYGYITAKPERKNQNFTELADYYVAEVPDIKPSRQADGPVKDLGLNLVLYQYQTCPFCCKVRAFLDYYGIPYDVVEVNPLKKQQLKFSKYKKVPILVAHDQKMDMKHQLNDSSVIISIMGSYLLDVYDSLRDVLKYYIPVKYTNDDGKEVTEVINRYFLMYGENVNSKPDEIREERKWRKWADEEFVHVLSPNIYRSREEALQAFNYFSEVGEWEKNFSRFERLSVVYLGATVMYFIGKRLKKKYVLKDDVRQSLYDASQMWVKNIGTSRKFMGGELPNLADLAVYGLLHSIEGCTAFKDLLANTSIGPWFSSMKKAVNNHHGFTQLKYHETKSPT